MRKFVHPRPAWLIALVTATALLLLAACLPEAERGERPPADGAGDGDVAAPTVVGTLPENGAAVVATNVTVSVTFSEAMDTSGTEAAFSILPAAEGSFSWSGSDAVLSFAPGSALSSDTQYSVTVGTGAADQAGNELESTYTFSFTTGSQQDTAAPTVTGNSPSDGETGVGTNTAVSVTFSEAMDGTSTEGAFSISPAADGGFGWAAGGTILTLTPSADLATGTEHTVTVGAGAKDTAGNALAAAHTFSFTTGSTADTTPPGDVTGFTATDGDGQAALNWTNPTDSDFAGVIICRDATSATDPTCTGGTTTYTGSGTGVTDTGLTNDTSYTYTAFAHDSVPNYSGGVSITATPTAGGGSNIPTDGLIAYYPFSGNANDESGNGYHGTVNGAVLTTDRHGNSDSAYNFDGINDGIFVDYYSNMALTNNVTLSLWVKINSANGHIAGFYRNNSLWDEPIRIVTKNGNIKFSVGINNNTVSEFSTSYLSAEWYHLTITFQDGSSHFYIDGSLADQQTASSTELQSTLLGFSIGDSADGSNQFPFWRGS